jgi:cell division protein FtsL
VKIRQLLGLGGVAIVLMLSALAVIYSKYYSRLIFIEIEKLEKTLDDYEVEWVQMQVEQTTLVEQNQIERAAREQKLIMPVRENIISIKP